MLHCQVLQWWKLYDTFLSIDFFFNLDNCCWSSNLENGHLVTEVQEGGEEANGIFSRLNSIYILRYPWVLDSLKYETICNTHKKIVLKSLSLYSILLVYLLVEIRLLYKSQYF